MDENDINDLLKSTLSGNTAGNNFKEKLLRDSTVAFTRVRIFHQRLRITGLLSLIIIFTTAAFLFGRFSVSQKTNERQIIVQHTNNDSISVPRDLIAWLDAAKFFTQLGMDQRAEFSYKQASQLIPVDIIQDSVVDIGQNIELAKVLKDYDKGNLKISEQEQEEIPKIITNKILAQSFGD